MRSLNTTHYPQNATSKFKTKQQGILKQNKTLEFGGYYFNLFYLLDKTYSEMASSFSDNLHGTTLFWSQINPQYIYCCKH